MWKPKNSSFLRYTSPQLRASAGGWDQAGLDKCIELQAREYKERKDAKSGMFGATKEERVDYFNYPPVEAEKKDDGANIEEEKAPDASEVAIEFEDEDNNLHIDVGAWEQV